ncbi:MAG: 5-guanidino-2-oxopentanoate decarboxylase [Alkalilacustris sp.]
METPAMMTCGEAVAHLLAQYGVRHVFGIPGVHNLELYRGLRGAGVAHISPRHEQGAVFMADGYARMARQPGVCFLITGPGATNALTGAAQAYGDSVPLLLIAAGSPRHDLGRGTGALHEMRDQCAVMAGAAGMAQRILDPANLAPALAEAFALFSAARPRPVYLEIPVDVLEAPWPGPMPDGAPAPVAAPHPAPCAVAAAADRLASARRALIVAGGGAVDAGPALRRLAEGMGAPVVLTSNARGLLPPDHPQLADNALGGAAAAEILTGCDLVLAVGTELGPTDFGGGARGLLRMAPRIRIDLDPAQMRDGRAGDVAIVGAAAPALAALADARAGREGAGPGPDPDWCARVVDGLGRLAAHSATAEDATIDTLLAALAAHPAAPVIVGDSTQPVYRGFRRHRAPRPLSWFNSATGFGTLGYALPAAIGARLAAPDRPVVALLGDGGLQFTLAELMSARDAVQDLLVIVWNNARYREIAVAMDEARIPPEGVEIAPPDLGPLAQAMGLAYSRIDDAATLQQAIAAEEFRGIRVWDVRAPGREDTRR